MVGSPECRRVQRVHANTQCEKSEVQMISRSLGFFKTALRTMAEPPPDAVPAVEERDDDGEMMLARLCCALR